MANKKYTYDNWLNGKFDYDCALLSSGSIAKEDYRLMLDKSYNIVIDKGKEEFNRLKNKCIRIIREGEKRESFNKSNFLKTEDDYYNLLLNKVPPEGNGYLKLSETKFNKFGNYDVALIRSVQKYHSWLTDGKINLVLPNPLNEMFNVNNGNEFTSAVLAVAWRYYRNYLKESLKPVANSKDKLKMRQIALIYAYEGKLICKGNEATEIAKQYGYTSKNSGESLYQDFLKYLKTIDRHGDEGTSKKNKNKLNNITSVLNYLTPEAKEKAEDDLLILKSLIQ